MPNYTTSYSNKKKPRYRRSDSAHLPSARRKQTRRKGGQYLRHSQGFSARSRRGGHRNGRAEDRRPYALIMVGCAFLLFLASIIWYSNRAVDITLNDTSVSVPIRSSIERIIEDQGLDLRAGNLLAVDDSVLEKGAGTSYTVKLGGKKLSKKEIAGFQVQGGEKLEIGDGEDVYEEHDVKATEEAPGITVKGTGAIQFVETWGVPGRSEVWTGKVSGKTEDRGVASEKVDCVIRRKSVSPADADEKLIAITLDGGPSAGTQKILDVLEEKGAKATFFLNRESISGQEDTVKAITEAGCELGTTLSGDIDLAKLSGDDLRSELTQGFDAVEQASGTKTALLRPPSGEFSETNWAQAMDIASAVATWNLDSGDWLLQGAETVADTVTGSAFNGCIVRLTDNDSTSEQTASALSLIIDRLKEEGYRFVTLSELVKTDEHLSEKLKSLTKVKMPKDAVLPKVSKEDRETGDS